jgi:membrane protein involved in colicin uptake
MSPSEVPSETERLRKKADNQRRFYQEEIVRREKAEAEVERVRLAGLDALLQAEKERRAEVERLRGKWQSTEALCDVFEKAALEWQERAEVAEKQVAEVHEMLWGIELLDGATYAVTPNTRQEAERVATTVPGAKVREVRNCRWSGVTLYDVPAEQIKH